MRGQVVRGLPCFSEGLVGLIYNTIIKDFEVLFNIISILGYTTHSLINSISDTTLLWLCIIILFDQIISICANMTD